MKIKYLSNFTFLLFFLTLVFYSQGSKGQVLSFSFTPSVPQCQPVFGINTASVQVTGTVAGASTYSWAVSGPFGCAPAYTLIFPQGSNGSFISTSYLCPGTYTINCFAYSPTSVLLSTASSSFVITPSPTISVSGSSFVCSGSGTTTLTASGSASSYSWTAGPAGPVSVVSPTVNTSYTVTGFLGVCSSSVVQLVQVIPPPIITVTASSNPVCIGGTVNLNAGGASSYSWSGGPSTSNYVTTPFGPTNYTVTGSVSGCTNSAVYSVSVNPLPTLTITGAGSSSVCPGITTTLVASGANTYTWNGGIINPSRIVSPNFTTTYTVIGANGNNCTASATKIVFVHPYSVVSIAPINNPTICAGASFTFTAFAGTTYTWSTGSNANLITVQPSVTATYSLFGTNVFGCLSIDTITVNVIPSAIANFSFVPLTSGQINFTNLSFNTSGNTSYIWNFGNGITSGAFSPIHTYTTNGVYAVTLSAQNSTCGISVTTQTVLVSNVAGPACAASFSYIAGANGTYTFISYSAGTTSSTVYQWNFGNGTYTNTGTAGMQPVQSFTYGTYNVALTILNSNPSCQSTYSTNIFVCYVLSDFNATQTSTNTINFVSTSTGTIPGSTFLWNYGDGFTGNGTTASHSYSTTNVYTVTMTAANGFSCTSTLSKTVALINCILSSNFTHTMLTNGLVKFNSGAAITSSITSYYWNFGDGIYSTVQNPQHTYSNAGTHFVTLIIKDSTYTFCKDSLTQALNITGVVCNANANFTLTPTNTPQYWNAIPSYPYNVTAASWSWGDGSTSPGLYASHTYSTAGNYSICLSVTVSCGSTSTYCYSYGIFRSNENSSQLVYVNVVAPAIGTGISTLGSNEEFSFELYPNPTSGLFNLSLNGLRQKKAIISVYSLVGELVYASEEHVTEEAFIKTLDLEGKPIGIYFIKLDIENKTFTKKIILNR